MLFRSPNFIVFFGSYLTKARCSHEGYGFLVNIDGDKPFLSAGMLTLPLVLIMSGDVLAADIFERRNR